MVYKNDGFNWVIRLEKGELLIEQLQNFIQQAQIRSGWISGLGGALWAELGFYHLDRQEYELKKIDTLLEITSLQGNISWKDDQPVLHVHGSFSDENMQGLGGHVKELAVGGTCEVFIHTLQGVELTRLENDEIGLSLLDL